MKRLILILLALGLVLPGCGKQRREVEVDEADMSVADTATVDPSGNAEAIPAVDPEVAVSAEQANSGVAALPPSSDPQIPASNAGMAPATSSPPPSTSGTGEMANYTIQKGDTLMKIAFNVYGDINQWKNIYDLNKDVLRSANKLAAGVHLKYDRPASEPNVEKNGDPYMIKKGDTLGSIADDIYAKKSKWKKLYENNRSLIRDPNRIYAGFYLYYQITEQEKREAEEIKAKRGGGDVAPTLGTTEKLPDSAGLNSVRTGGLSGLSAPSNQRVPASAK